MHPFPWISWKQPQTHARAFGFSALSGFVGCQQEAWKSQVTDHLHVPHQKAEERASLESSKYRFCSVPSHCSWPDNLHLSFFPHFYASGIVLGRLEPAECWGYELTASLRSCFLSLTSTRLLSLLLHSEQRRLFKMCLPFLTPPAIPVRTMF